MESLILSVYEEVWSGRLSHSKQYDHPVRGFAPDKLHFSPIQTNLKLSSLQGLHVLEVTYCIFLFLPENHNEPFVWFMYPGAQLVGFDFWVFSALLLR